MNSEIDVKTTAHQQMTQERGHASVPASLVASWGTSFHTAPVVAGMFNARRLFATRHYPLNALCVAQGLTKQRNESRAKMAFGIRGCITKQGNIIRGENPQVATG